MPDALVQEIVEAYEYDKQGWHDIREEARKDMRFVSGNPWDQADLDQRKDRPTIAPEELSQYRNQVINALMANPRGAQFAPVGNGANDKTAEFYQNKWREIEYRSRASQAYSESADNALQRGYGFVRIKTGYISPRSANQEITIEGFPDPDMVTPDCDALKPDSSDMTRCTVDQWMPQSRFLKQFGSKAKIRNFGDFTGGANAWVQGSKIRVGEHWTIKTTLRTLLLVEIPAPVAPDRTIAPQQGQSQSFEIFEDELAQLKARMPLARVVRTLREVDYPHVWMYLTNGIEILHQQEWLGKYIPIVSCYGKVLYVDEDGEAKRKILSLTRFGRDPWKAFCYACSQQLEILGQVPKASVVAYPGQLAGFEKDWQEAPHVPKAFLYANAKTTATGEQILPLPQRLSYAQGDYLQMIEVVKEGFRRSIQAAMGSNFMPTKQTSGVDRHSGDALDKIDDVATQGTYHFVYSYEGLIRHCAVIGEDLIDKIHDVAGETGVMLPDGGAKSVPINQPDVQDAYPTNGDHLVTISTAPSSDSEREAAQDFTELLVKEISMIAQIAGPQAAKQILAVSVRMRGAQLGPMSQELADILDPPQMGADGKPIPPELQAAQGQIQQLEQQLQKAGQVIQTKQVEQQGKLAITQEQEKHEDFRAALDREKGLAIAEIQAQSKQALQDMALFYEERTRIGAHLHEQAMGGAESAHNVHLAREQQAHEHVQNRIGHMEDLAKAALAVAIQPPPTEGAPPNA